MSKSSYSELWPVSVWGAAYELSSLMYKLRSFDSISNFDIFTIDLVPISGFLKQGEALVFEVSNPLEE